MLARLRITIAAAGAATCLISLVSTPAFGTIVPHRALNAGYMQYPGLVFNLSVGKRAYDSAVITPVQGFGLRDSTGVRMGSYGGKIYNQPLSQAQYALANLNSYRLTGNQAYLQIAVLNAQRILDRSVASDGARYFRYDFPYAPLHDTSEQLPAPWFSAMAQGEALSTFTRLFAVTHDTKWRTAADAAFKSLTQAPEGRAPFVSYVDTTKRLWLEEYPRYPSSMSENVLNGHIFATFGLLDYWQLTHNTQALSVIRGAIATVQATVMSKFRRANGESVYSLRHKTPAGYYHGVVIQQFLQLVSYTQNQQFAQMATTFMQDYPNYRESPRVAGTVSVTPQESIIYKLNAAGAIIASKAVHFQRLTSFPTDARVRITHGPIALRDTTGPYAGWYFPEGPNRAWVRAVVGVVNYPLRLAVHVSPGTFTGYQLNAAGAVVGTKTIRFTSTTSIATNRSATVLGRPCFYITSGSFAGYWLPMQPALHI